MFEYLMPLLVMPTYETRCSTRPTRRQSSGRSSTGRQRGVPWGISESGYNAIDVHLNYQYRAFGVPGLGLKRGLGRGPGHRALCLGARADGGARGGVREPAAAGRGRAWRADSVSMKRSTIRLRGSRAGKSSAVVRSFMAHHQGMSLLSLAYRAPGPADAEALRVRSVVPGDHCCCCRNAFPRPRRSIRTPRSSPTAHDARGGARDCRCACFTSPNTPMPEVQLLSNGRYHVMVTNAGRRLQPLEGPRRDALARRRDLATTGARSATSATWRAGSSGRPRISRRSSSGTATRRSSPRRARSSAAATHDFETHTEIAVSPEDDIELRRITHHQPLAHTRERSRSRVTRKSCWRRRPPTRCIRRSAISSCRPRSCASGRRSFARAGPARRDEHAPWMFHLMAVHGADVGRGVLRNRSHAVHRPRTIRMWRSAGDDDSARSRAARARCSIRSSRSAIGSHLIRGNRRRSTWCPASATPATPCWLVDKYQDRRLADRVFELAWTHSQVVLRQLNATEADAQLYAGSPVRSLRQRSLRADAERARQEPPGTIRLWGYSISGDLPIVLLQIGDAANIDLVRQLVQAHAYWRLKARGRSGDLE